MKKKVGVSLSLLIFMLVAAVVLNACSKSSTKENNQAPPKNEPSTNQIITLKLYPGNPVMPKPEDNLTLQELKKILGVNIELPDTLQGKSATYKDVYNLAIASGHPPDWFNNLTFAEYHNYVRQDVLAPITPEMVQKHAPRLYEWYRKYINQDDPFMFHKVDGVNYAMPGVWTLGPSAYVAAIREDWLANAGIAKLPETLDEWEAALKLFRNNDPDGNHKKDTYGWSTTISPDSISGFFSPIFGAYGVYPGIFTEENGKVARGEIEPNAKEALTVLNRWYKEELIDPEFVVDKDQNVKEKWLAQRYGFATGPWWGFLPQRAFVDGFYHDQLLAKNPSAKVTVLSAPKGPEGKQGFTQINPLGVGIMFSKTILKDEGKLEKYLEFLDKQTFDQNVLELWWYGVVGKTAKKSAEGDYEWIPPYEKPEERNKIGVGPDVGFLGLIQDYDALTPFMTQNKYLSLRKETEKKGTGKYDILQTITKPVYDEYQLKLGQFTVKNYIDFVIGKRPLSEFDKFVEEWRSMGGDKVMQEAQEVYDKAFKK